MVDCVCCANNRPFAARDLVLRYRIATLYWKASIPVSSDIRHYRGHGGLSGNKDYTG